MGFFDALGQLAGYAVKSGMESISKGSERMNRASDRASDMSDDELREKFRSTGDTWQKAAYLKEYKSRHDD